MEPARGPITIASKVLTGFTAVALTAGVILSGNGTVAAPQNESGTNSSEQDQMELGAVIKAVEDALKESQGHPVEGFPHLQSVKVTVQTTVSKDIDGKVKIFVFNVGGKRGTQQVSSMSFELKPPPPPKAKPGVASIRPENLKAALARELQYAKESFVAAEASSKTLKTSTIGISIGFVVSKQGQGGIDTGQLLPIGVTANGSYSRSSGNTIALEFAKNPKGSTP